MRAHFGSLGRSFVDRRQARAMIAAFRLRVAVAPVAERTTQQTSDFSDLKRYNQRIVSNAQGHSVALTDLHTCGPRERPVWRCERALINGLATSSTSTNVFTANLAMFDLFAGRNRRTTTKEESLEHAKKKAEEWYLGLQLKHRSGELRGGKLFGAAAAKTRPRRMSDL